MGGHKGVIFCIKTCFRSVCRHPFLLGMVFSMIFLYKYFPFMFSLLVVASPVFMTTAALLATILSYGKPNIPAIQKERRLSTENVFSRTGVQTDGSFFKRNDNFDNVERFLEIRRGVVNRSIGEASSSAINFSGSGRDDTWPRNNAVLAKKKSREFQIDKQGSDVERKSPDTVFQKNDKLTDLKEGKSESLGIQESHEKSHDQKQNKSPKKVDGNFPIGAHWKQEDEGEDDDRDLSDSGSDRTESISPGTSITDISPIDELHPLLDEDAPQPTLMSTEISDATSEGSSNTISESSYDLDTDMETHGEELEVTDLEEEIYADNDDDVKSAVSWTDDDHKNVINLGSSDLERNQRLENLIATRSLRKSMMSMAERNLIDFDGIDRPPNVAHISTARRNPFDLNSNLPGSAPSIMVPRRSPFELPYDPGEEKHDLMGDDYEHVVTLQPKDHPPFLRRNETFNAGPSLLGTSRHDYYLRPDYVLQRISSGLSESKTSSEPETESLGSVEELEDRIPVEEDDFREPLVTTITEHPSEDVGHGSESKASSEPETESLGSVEELEDKIPVEEDDSREPVVTTFAEHPSEEVGHGSESSEDEDTFESTEAEKNYVTPVDIRNLGDVDSTREKVLSMSETAVADTHMEGDTSEANEVVTPDSSSSTSLYEEHEVFNEKDGEQLSHLKQAMEISDTESTSQSVDDTHHKEPVYDSSPTARLSSSSICSDNQVDIVERNESDISNQITEKNTPATETDEKLIFAHHQSPENNTSIQSEKEPPTSDQSIVEHSPVKHEELQDSAKCVNATQVQELVEETQQNGKPTTSEAAASTRSEILETEATPDRPDSEGNIPCVENSDAILISEKPLLEKTGSGPAELEEVLSRNAGETISDVPVESGTVKDEEPRVKEDEHTDDESGGSEISPREDKIPHVGTSGTILISEKTGSGPADSEEVPRRNTGETISDMPVESGTVKDKEPQLKEDEHREESDDGSGGSEIGPREKVPIPNAGETISDMSVESGTVKDKELRYEEDEHRDDGSGGSEIAPREEVPSQNAGETISDMPVESGTVKDKEPSYEEDEHRDDGSGELELSPESPPSLEAEAGLPVAEAQSFDDVKTASKQVDGVDFKESSDLSLNEPKDGYSEHVPDEIGSESSSSVQESHSEQHHEEAYDKKDLPDSKNDDPKQSPQPNAWWSRFRST